MKVVTEGEGKKKKYNKNKKKAWRKKADISEIEAILDDVRREERFGGPLDEREDEDLMFLDTGDYETGSGLHTDKKDAAVELQFELDTTPGSSAKKRVETFKPSKKPVNKEPIKAFKFINGLQGAKVPIKPRMKAGVVTAAMQEKAKRIAEDPKTAKKYQKKVEDIRGGLTRKHRVKVTNFKSKNKKDIWEEADDTVKECYDKGLDEDYLDNIATYYKAQTKKGQKVAVPSHRLKKPSAHPAVPLPVAGMSYHPTFEDHQEALRQAVKDIKKKRKIEKKIAKYSPAELKRLKSKLRAAQKNDSWSEDLIENHSLINDTIQYSGDVEEKKNEQKRVKTEKQTKGKKGGNKKGIVKEEVNENTESVTNIVKEEMEDLEAEDQHIDTDDNEEIDEDDVDEENEGMEDDDEEIETEDDLDEEIEPEDDLDEEIEAEDDLDEEVELEEDDLDEEKEVEQDDHVEGNEVMHDEIDEEKDTVQDNNLDGSVEIDSEKENALQPKTRIRKRGKRKKKNREANRATTKAVQMRVVKQNQEIKEKEIITVSDLQKGLIQPKKRNTGNVRKDFRTTDQAQNVQDREVRLTNGVNNEPAVENTENVENRRRRGRKRKAADSGGTNSMKMKKTENVQEQKMNVGKKEAVKHKENVATQKKKAVESKENVTTQKKKAVESKENVATQKKEAVKHKENVATQKKKAVESKENVATQKKEELKEENDHSDETNNVEGEKTEDVTWKKTRRGGKKHKKGDQKEEEEEVEEPVIKKTSHKKTEKQRKLERMKKYKKSMWEKRIKERDRERKIELVPAYLDVLRDRTLRNRARQDRKRLVKNEKKFATRRLAPLRFMAEDTTVCDGDKLPGSLRRVRPVGNLFHERVKHLQRRNIIAPGVDKLYGKKGNLKKVIRRNYKDDRTMKSVYDD
ncbi:caldesmon-like [Penaeus chinensis]|uniref:caldesmon-like n=1 Tax=Penaeus chinensis TaxID=139456 RepID=UPI001FB7C25A|nr:caldesmon-like [Penaeus chinensis]